MVSELTNSKHLSRQTFHITHHWFVRQDVVEILGTKTLESLLIKVSGQMDSMTKAAKIKEEFTDPDLIGVDFNNLKRKADVDTAPKPRKRARKAVEKAKEAD
jgi:hypothetical protein